LIAAHTHRSQVYDSPRSQSGLIEQGRQGRQGRRRFLASSSQPPDFSSLLNVSSINCRARSVRSSGVSCASSIAPPAAPLCCCWRTSRHKSERRFFSQKIAAVVSGG